MKKQPFVIRPRLPGKRSLPPLSSLQASRLREIAIDHVRLERLAQNAKWGTGPENLVYSDKPDRGFNFAVLTEEVGEVAEAIVEGRSDQEILEELTQVAAVACAWIEQILRQKEGK